MAQPDGSQSYYQDIQLSQIHDTRAERILCTNDNYHLNDTIHKLDVDAQDAFRYVCHFMFTQAHMVSSNAHDGRIHEQMNSTKGIKLFGEAAVNALLKEFVTQFEKLEVY